MERPSRGPHVCGAEAGQPSVPAGTPSHRIREHPQPVLEATERWAHLLRCAAVGVPPLSASPGRPRRDSPGWLSGSLCACSVWRLVALRTGPPSAQDAQNGSREAAGTPGIRAEAPLPVRGLGWKPSTTAWAPDRRHFNLSRWCRWSVEGCCGGCVGLEALPWALFPCCVMCGASKSCEYTTQSQNSRER